jgi:hypothetical protein
MAIALPIIIGDYVWRDTNNDGVQNDGVGSALAGVVVTLHADDGTQLASTTTAADGSYSFSSLDTPGLRPSTSLSLRIQLDTQPVLATTVGGRDTFLVPTQIYAGSSTTDNDAVLSVDERVAIISLTLPPRFALNATEYDFGLTDPPLLGFYVGDYVWLDTNDNNAQDAGEPVLPNVVVELYDGVSNALVASTTTNSSGVYSFHSALDGYTLDAQQSYTMRIADAQPSLDGLLPVLNDAAGDDAIDSDGVPSGGNGVSLAFNAPIDGQDDLTFDFGTKLSLFFFRCLCFVCSLYSRRVSLGFRRLVLDGVVFADDNADGQLEPAETTRFAGLVVSLTETNGNVVATTLSQADGSYSFSSQQYPLIAPRSMFDVVVDLTPTGGAQQPTLRDVGDDATDSDGYVVANQTTLVRNIVFVLIVCGR